MHNVQILVQKWNVFSLLPGFSILIFSTVAYMLSLLYTFLQKIATVLLRSRCHEELNGQTVIYHSSFWQDKSTPTSLLIYQPFHCSAHFCEVLCSDVMSKADLVLTDPLPSASQSFAANVPQLLCQVMLPVHLAEVVIDCLISEIKSYKLLNQILRCSFQ